MAANVLDAKQAVDREAAGGPKIASFGSFLITRIGRR